MRWIFIVVMTAPGVICACATWGTWVVRSDFAYLVCVPQGCSASATQQQVIAVTVAQNHPAVADLVAVA